jgi:hypothetical protein
MIDLTEDLAGAEEDVEREQKQFIGYCESMLKSYDALQSYRETVTRIKAQSAANEGTNAD